MRLGGSSGGGSTCSTPRPQCTAEALCKGREKRAGERLVDRLSVSLATCSTWATTRQS